MFIVSVNIDSHTPASPGKSGEGEFLVRNKNNNKNYLDSVVSIRPFFLWLYRSMRRANFVRS